MRESQEMALLRLGQSLIASRPAIVSTFPRYASTKFAKHNDSDPLVGYQHMVF